MSPQPAVIRVYVATSYARRCIARAFMNALRERGFVITYDWTRHEVAQLDTEDGRARIAIADLEGVRRADVFVALLPGGFRTHAELGAALGGAKPCLVVAHDAEQLAGDHPLPFYWAPGVTRLVSTRAAHEAVAWLEDFRERVNSDRENDSSMVWG